MHVSYTAKSASVLATFAVVSLMLALTAIDMYRLESGRRRRTGNDGLSFGVTFDEDVAIRISTASRYGLDADADAQWDRILPKDGHLVYLLKDDDSDPEPHTVTLFHQLKCLQILRSEYQAVPDEVSARAQHCFNYLRQTILCEPNLRLESVRTEEGVTDHNYYDTVCRDWNSVYEEAERNQGEYASRIRM